MASTSQPPPTRSTGAQTLVSYSGRLSHASENAHHNIPDSSLKPSKPSSLEVAVVGLPEGVRTSPRPPRLSSSTTCYSHSISSLSKPFISGSDLRVRGWLCKCACRHELSRPLLSFPRLFRLLFSSAPTSGLQKFPIKNLLEASPTS
ncbi:hypothetical protein GUJ93_ZPchr0002g24878 [Zizania palustris]|uniref:Uncharacterized protein n=1 Tax=Zizania palustris TaxID=103762 RepID=A0A8J5RMJ8_ZIZPA|nr:hypothetical protein GUJ93_ZPchr0002g24878 [Zizania palustris]